MLGRPSVGRKSTKTRRPCFELQQIELSAGWVGGQLEWKLESEAKTIAPSCLWRGDLHSRRAHLSARSALALGGFVQLVSPPVCSEAGAWAGAEVWATRPQTRRGPLLAARAGLQVGGASGRRAGSARLACARR